MKEQYDISLLRAEIDECDRELVNLLCKRMEICQRIALYKKEANMPIFDPARERALLARIAELSGEEYKDYMRVIYSSVLSASKSHQSDIIYPKGETAKLIEKTLEGTKKTFPKEAKVAVQGVEGAYSQIAASRLFQNPDISFYRSFSDVFEAVNAGKAKYGVLPIENSAAGSVDKVYDLLREWGFYIVKAVSIKVDHCLLAKKGTKISDITEICSHEQAINQCSKFLSSFPGAKIYPSSNTARAAQFTRETEDMGVAALSSRACAELYGLEILCESVQDTDNNHTRFICISKEAEIYPDADRTTVIFTAEDRPGALYSALSEFYARGLNLAKLESRPIPGSDFDVLFYLDISESVYSESLMAALSALEGRPGFRYLGSYGGNI